MALIIAVLSVPSFGFASTAPDGYERSVANAQASGLPIGTLASAEKAGPINAAVQQWQTSLNQRFPGSELVKATTSTLAFGLLAFGLAVCCAGGGELVV